VNNTKILVLLIALVTYINYQNYFKVDIRHLAKKIDNLKSNIKREEKIKDENLSKNAFSLNYENLFFNGKKESYSQAMGHMQKEVADALNGVCRIENIKWAEAPISYEWYDELAMNISLTCSPKNFLIAVNRFNKTKKLYKVKSITMRRNITKQKNIIFLKLLAFRLSK